MAFAVTLEPRNCPRCGQCLSISSTTVILVRCSGGPVIWRKSKGDRVAAEITQALAEKCPMTHHVYLLLLEEAEAIMTLPDALALDFQLAIKMTARPDFVEGVRAVLIDKTNDADWQPARLADVSRAMVDDVFVTTGLPVLR